MEVLPAQLMAAKTLLRSLVIVLRSVHVPCGKLPSNVQELLKSNAANGDQSCYGTCYQSELAVNEYTVPVPNLLVSSDFSEDIVFHIMAQPTFQLPVGALGQFCVVQSTVHICA